jgi:hypothetical protein
MSDKLALFAEYAPNLVANHAFSYIFDGGVTYASGKTRQFDLRLGELTDSNGLHALFSVGYSRRYDHFFADLADDSQSISVPLTSSPGRKA